MPDAVAEQPKRKTAKQEAKEEKRALKAAERRGLLSATEVSRIMQGVKKPTPAAIVIPKTPDEQILADFKQYHKSCPTCHGDDPFCGRLHAVAVYVSERDYEINRLFRQEHKTIDQVVDMIYHGPLKKLSPKKPKMINGQPVTRMETIRLLPMEERIISRAQDVSRRMSRKPQAMSEETRVKLRAIGEQRKAERAELPPKPTHKPQHDWVVRATDKEARAGTFRATIQKLAGKGITVGELLKKGGAIKNIEGKIDSMLAFGTLARVNEGGTV